MCFAYNKDFNNFHKRKQRKRLSPHKRYRLRPGYHVYFFFLQDS